MNLGIPVLQGPLRGKRWIAGSGNHGCWLGTYELSTVQRLALTVQPGMTCLDIGANVGYYTLLFSKLTGPSGRVFAFEPLPANGNYLRRHVRMNRCQNVRVFDLALTDFNGEAAFAEHENRSMGNLSNAGSLTVHCTTLETLLRDGEIETPHVLKIDVEGAELAVLLGGRQILQAAKPFIFLATHGPEVHEACCSFLKGIGYHLEPLDCHPVESSCEFLAVAQ
jgi:FkbM family methyltransferase